MVVAKAAQYNYKPTAEEFMTALKVMSYAENMRKSLASIQTTSNSLDGAIKDVKKVAELLFNFDAHRLGLEDLVWLKELAQAGQADKAHAPEKDMNKATEHI